MFEVSGCLFKSRGLQERLLSQCILLFSPLDSMWHDRGSNCACVFFKCLGVYLVDCRFEGSSMRWKAPIFRRLARCKSPTESQLIREPG